MITPSQWKVNGYWGDSNTPDLSFQQYRLFGSRVSPLISLAPAVQVLGGIGSAVIWWAGTFPKHTGAEVFVRLDGEQNWNRIEKGELILGISNDLKKPETRSVQVKIVLRTTLSEANPDLTPELDELYLVVYKNDKAWKTENLSKLVWRDET